MSGVRREWVMPYAEDVLNDPSFSDSFNDCGYLVDPDQEEEEEEGIRRRVLYRIPTTRGGQPFKSLSPPPTHFAFFLNHEDDRIDEESLEHWLNGNASSTGHPPPSFSIDLSSKRASVAYVCTLLRNLPPHSHLLFFFHRAMGARSTGKIVDALLQSRCHLDVLASFSTATSKFLLNPQVAYKLGGRCRALYLDFSGRQLKSGHASFASFLSDLMSSPDCKLLELLLDRPLQTADDDKYSADQGSINQSLAADDSEDRYKIGIRGVLHQLAAEGCTLKRLDMRGLPSLGPKNMSLLVASIASPACPIHDLGINLSSGDIDNVDEAQHKSGLSILARAFQSESSLSKLKALRFRISTEEAADCVVQILRSPQSNCKVRLFDIHFSKHYDADEPFFKKLQQGTMRPPPCNIECLWVFFDDEVNTIQINSELSSLSDFLSWEHCSLLWLHCRCGKSMNSMEEPLQDKIANSLEANYLLRYLYISALSSPPACARAVAFLARNRLHKSMGLSKEECMKPQVARLFLCGHAEVGKTTLCKSLLKLQTHPTHHSFNKLFRSCRYGHTSREGLEPRTRGIEIHQLYFQPANQKLSIFDLGGQPDYHIFHHYFMTNTSHDLFTIVGKYSISTRASQLAAELEYWFKFIVSHRNTVHRPNPKVILVINFFNVPQSLDMQAKAEDLTEDLIEKYGLHLDFGGVFGIVALDKAQAVQILSTLERLLQDCLQHKPLIPRLCHDLLTSTLPQLVKPKEKSTCGVHLLTKAPTSKLMVSLSQIEARCMQQQNQQGNQEQQIEGQDFDKMLRRRVHAALVELHNTGEVIFFPPTNSTRASKGATGAASIVSKEQEVMARVAEGSTSSYQTTNDSSPIITDPNWFCNKVIGNLLAPAALSGKSVLMTYGDVMQVLVDSGCAKHFVDEVLRYLHNLEFCLPLYDSASSQTKYFFPVGSSNNKLQWPPKFSSKISSGSSANCMHFYGRRIKCKDTERNLIPSGVFTRLQVRLNKFCGVGTKQSYKLGYHWVSFVTQGIGVMVRFGRVSKGTNLQDDEQASGLMSTQPLTMSMKEDDRPEWIDILLCCPSSQTTQQQATSAEYTIMNGIKNLIFDICQATYRGIPTVTLEEYVLRHEAQKDVLPLSTVHSCINKEGLSSNVAWEDQHDIAAVDLLLPEELQDHVMRHVQAVQDIQEEFATKQGGEKGEENEEIGDGNQLLYDQLHGEFKVLCDVLLSKFDTRFERLGAKMDNIMVLAKEIKQDVCRVIDGLQQAQMKIVANCSTRLLTQVLLRSRPAYPYLKNSDGKMEQLKRLLLRKTATIHFLCESRKEGPHEVKGQVGKEVVVEKGLLMKMAPFLVPTLTVLCCAGRFAANVYLPGVAPIIFSPLLDCLKSIGITEKDLQSQIMPKALSALFDELDVQIQGLYDPKLHMINVDEQQRKEGEEALQEFLGSIEDIDMEKDFGLYLVQVGHVANELVEAHWYCEEHAKGHRRLIHRQNPFSHVTK